MSGRTFVLLARRQRNLVEMRVNGQEERLLAALALMCAQYLERGDSLDHMCMHAGEHAMVLLKEYGLVDSEERGARWTESGQAFLHSH